MRKRRIVIKHGSKTRWLMPFSVCAFGGFTVLSSLKFGQSIDWSRRPRSRLSVHTSLPHTIQSSAMLLLFVLAITLGHCHGQVGSQTIMEYVESQKLTTLVGFLRGTGLDKELGDKDASAATLFAPTEAAWKKLDSTTLLSIATNSTKLKSVLLNHVASEIVIGYYVRDGDKKTNLNGDKMDFRVYANGAKTVDGAHLIGQDVSLANGIVHMIDDVILPSEHNIGEYVAQDESDFKDLFGLLILGRVFTALETGGPFTIFAPLDSAFDKISGNLTALISDRNALGDVLKYHVVPNTYWSVGLTDGMSLTTLQGQAINVTIGPSGVMLNGQATVVQADTATSNGVIHTIDHVLTPA